MHRFLEIRRPADLYEILRDSLPDVSIAHPDRGGRDQVGRDVEVDLFPGICGAIASCLDSTIRVVCNRDGVKLKELSVEVDGQVDVRGTLRVDRNTAVGFRRFDIKVHIEPEGFVPKIMLRRIVKGAEASCVVLQTLRGVPDLAVEVQ